MIEKFRHGYSTWSKSLDTGTVRDRDVWTQVQYVIEKFRHGYSTWSKSLDTGTVRDRKV